MKHIYNFIRLKSDLYVDTYAREVLILIMTKQDQPWQDTNTTWRYQR